MLTDQAAGRTRSPAIGALVDGVARVCSAHPYRVVVAVLALVSVAQLVSRPRWAGAWFYVTAAVHILASPHWFQLYALRPDIQMGPLTFLVAAPLVLILKGEAARFAGVLLMLVLGLAVAREAQRLLAPEARAMRWRWLLASVLFAVAWPELALRFGHLDDALALLFAVLAIRLLREDRPLAAALAIGVSVDCKPWMLPLTAALLMAGRRRWRAIGVVALVVAAAWAPFFLADPASVRALTFRIPIGYDTTLSLLGFRHGGTPPWCRPVQFLGAALLVAVAVRRGRPLAALLVVVAFRMLLDPGDKTYYASGLLAGALLLDVEAVVPVATLAGLVLVLGPAYFVPHDVSVLIRILRTIGLVGLLAAAFATPLRRPPDGSNASRADLDRVVSPPEPAAP